MWRMNMCVDSGAALACLLLEAAVRLELKDPPASAGGIREESRPRVIRTGRSDAKIP
jgi:hypothetical protein